MFSPDSPLAADVSPSPNHGERRGGIVPTMLILHYTGMETGAAALRRLVNPRSEVSCHYLIFEDGRIVQMVAEERRAWHAGESSWEGQVDINSRSIGIEIVNGGHANGYEDFPDVQMDAVAALCRDIVARWGIKAWHVLAHSDVAPMRKMDPGERFDWRRLANAGVGLWVPMSSLKEGSVLSLGSEGQAVADLQMMLSQYGYGVAQDGHYDSQTEAVIKAFQRHFRQARVDGIADTSTIATLRDLLAAKSQLAPQN